MVVGVGDWLVRPPAHYEHLHLWQSLTCWSFLQTQVFWILGQFFGLMPSFLSRRQSCFSIKSHCESILLMLMLFKTTHLVLPFSFYTLINLMMLSVIHYLCSCFYYLLKVWLGVYFVVKAKINLWTCIWPARPCGMRHVDCWFQCWKNTTCSIWLFE